METTEFYLAATLMSLGYQVDYKATSTKQVVFVFPDEAKELLDDYYAKRLMIEPITFSECQKQLKGRIHNQ